MADADKAIADYTAALQLDPEHADAYHYRAYARACQGDDERAIADYAEFIRREPTDETAYYNRANAWFRLGEFDKAIADFTESIRLDPTDGLAYLNRGQAMGPAKANTKRPLPTLTSRNDSGERRGGFLARSSLKGTSGSQPTKS